MFKKKSWIKKKLNKSYHNIKKTLRKRNKITQKITHLTFLTLQSSSYLCSFLLFYEKIFCFIWTFISVITAKCHGHIFFSLFWSVFISQSYYILACLFMRIHFCNFSQLFQIRFSIFSLFYLFVYYILHRYEYPIMSG